MSVNISQYIPQNNLFLSRIYLQLHVVIYLLSKLSKHITTDNKCCTVNTVLLYILQSKCTNTSAMLLFPNNLTTSILVTLFLSRSFTQECLQPFTNGCFMEIDGRPLCSVHYYSRQGMLCGGCGEPITSRCIAALNRKFHPEHFVCAFCLRQLNHGIFKEQNGKPYCSTCFSKLFV